MPVYLCQSGAGCTEPWRHGIQVYSHPFPINPGGGGAPAGGGRDAVVLPATSPDVLNWESQQQQLHQQTRSEQGQQSRSQPHASSTQSSDQRLAGMAVRRVRHAEIVLVDDVCIAYGRYWLRLRWPGQREGFAGYIAMGLVEKSFDHTPTRPQGRRIQYCYLRQLRLL